ncbi:MAG: alpha-glucosidase [Lachnospiraceae bacterium]|nr:alpha-glucosidase [Lachnospiraceae bacterium]
MEQERSNQDQNQRKRQGQNQIQSKNQPQPFAAKWWQNAVIYQIYPRSFQDSNGDGIGDLQGIIQRLDYLERLGIDGIWLSPVCKSPQDDNGYDISDYQDIDPMFGNLSDMEQLIGEAKKRNIRIIMDLVLNHTSDEHPWFKEAKSKRDNPYHEYYVWRDGEEGTPPNEMRACFGGSAWQWVPEVGQYYFHQFSVRQPDLNWDNPSVRQEIYRMIRWWMDKGVGGFRLDVIDQIAKVPDKGITNNGPLLHTYIQELSRETFQKGDLVTVGEAWGATPELARLYSNPDGREFSMVFQFEHINLDQQEGKEKWDLASLPFLKLKEIFNQWQTSLYGCGWNSLFWDNHDLPRIVSRWGDEGRYRVESAKMLATLLHGMQGTPYIYQGEELGMTNVKYDIQDYRDIETLNMYRERMELGYGEEEIMASIYAKSRDNARTPMQWDGGKYAGFSEREPWIRVNPNYQEINSRAQVGVADSVFEYYRKLIKLRKEYPVLTDGCFRLLLEKDEQIFAYLRENEESRILVVCNFFGKPARCELEESWDETELLIGNYEEGNDRPGEMRAEGIRSEEIRPRKMESGEMKSGKEGSEKKVGKIEKTGFLEVLRPYEARMYLARK